MAICISGSPTGRSTATFEISKIHRALGEVQDALGPCWARQGGVSTTTHNQPCLLAYQAWCFEVVVELPSLHFKTNPCSIDEQALQVLSFREFDTSCLVYQYHRVE